MTTSSRAGMEHTESDRYALLRDEVRRRGGIVDEGRGHLPSAPKRADEVDYGVQPAFTILGACVGHYIDVRERLFIEGVQPLDTTFELVEENGLYGYRFKGVEVGL